MIRFGLCCVTLTVLMLVIPGAAFGVDPKNDDAPYTSVAILPFQERGRNAVDLGGQVTDLLFAELLTSPEFLLVEREDISKLFAEQTLSQTGLVDPARATQVGHLTGAKVIVTGSVIVAGEKLYLVAKVMGTETTRVLGASAKGSLRDDLGDLVAELASGVTDTVVRHSAKLVAKPVTQQDRITSIANSLPEGPRPSVWIHVSEQHVGRTTVDPAAETELAHICRELGFTVIDRDEGKRSAADVLILGEGMSQFAVRHGDLNSVKARLEVKAVDRVTGQLLAIDRQVTINVDLAEQIAAKAALQEAAARLAQRLLPKIVRAEENQNASTSEGSDI